MHNGRLYLIFGRSRYLPFLILRELFDNTVVQGLERIIAQSQYEYWAQFDSPILNIACYSTDHNIDSLQVSVLRLLNTHLDAYQLFCVGRQVVAYDTLLNDLHRF